MRCEIILLIGLLSILELLVTAAAADLSVHVVWAPTTLEHLTFDDEGRGEVSSVVRLTTNGSSAQASLQPVVTFNDAEEECFRLTGAMSVFWDSLSFRFFALNSTARSLRFKLSPNIQLMTTATFEMELDFERCVSLSPEVGILLTPPVLTTNGTIYSPPLSISPTGRTRFGWGAQVSVWLSFTAMILSSIGIALSNKNFAVTSLLRPNILFFVRESLSADIPTQTTVPQFSPLLANTWPWLGEEKYELTDQIYAVLMCLLVWGVLLIICPLIWALREKVVDQKPKEITFSRMRFPNGSILAFVMLWSTCCVACFRLCLQSLGDGLATGLGAGVLTGFLVFPFLFWWQRESLAPKLGLPSPGADWIPTIAPHQEERRGSLSGCGLVLARLRWSLSRFFWVSGSWESRSFGEPANVSFLQRYGFLFAGVRSGWAPVVFTVDLLMVGAYSGIFVNAKVVMMDESQSFKSADHIAVPILALSCLELLVRILLRPEDSPLMFICTLLLLVLQIAVSSLSFHALKPLSENPVYGSRCPWCREAAGAVIDSAQVFALCLALFMCVLGAWQLFFQEEGKSSGQGAPSNSPASAQPLPSIDGNEQPLLRLPLERRRAQAANPLS